MKSKVLESTNDAQNKIKIVLEKLHRDLKDEWQWKETEVRNILQTKSNENSRRLSECDRQENNEQRRRSLFNVELIKTTIELQEEWQLAWKRTIRTDYEF